MNKAIDKAKLLRSASYASVFTAILLIIVKLLAYLASGSASVLSSLFDSILDSGTSIFNFFAIRESQKPADATHRFGHGKLESISGLAQAIIIFGSAIYLIYTSSQNVWSKHEISHPSWGIAAMVFTIIATLLLVRFQKYVVRKTDSPAISADSLHYTGDIFLNTGVIISLILSSWANLSYLDHWFAIGISIFLIKSAVQIIYHSLQDLMDKELNTSTRHEIRKLTMSHPQVRGIEQLRTRRSGQKIFIELNLLLNANLLLQEAHQISEEVKKILTLNYPEAEIMIHQEPYSL